MPSLESFHEQVKRGDVEGVREALRVEPSLLEAVNASGQSAFLLASYYGRKDVAAYLLSLHPKLDLFEACVAGMQERVLSEIDSDSPLMETHSSDGWTPLHLASFFGHAELAKALLNRGAKVNALSTNRMENTPLHAAIAGRRVGTAAVLLDYQADVNARQHGGWTALHGAAQAGDRELVELLVRAGAHVQARADNQQSPLDLALLAGHQEIAQQLEEAGAQLA